MDLDALRAMVAGTTPADWNPIAAYGDNAAPITPTPLESTSHDDECGPLGTFYIRSHTNLLVLRSDVDISIAYGMPADMEAARREKFALQPPWARPGWALSFTIADLRYRGVLVDRLGMVEVKNLGRAVLPVPRTADAPDSARIINKVSGFHCGLAQLLHSVLYPGDMDAFETQLNRAGIEISD